MKIKQLRELIIESDGKLVIGKLSFEMKKDEDGKDGDIDIHFNEHLIQWVKSETDGEKELSDDEICNVQSDFLEFKDKLFEAQRAKIKAEEMVEEIKLASVSSELLKGKVEAYEKMLIGRGVTLTN
jgi:hypothetical protein